MNMLSKPTLVLAALTASATAFAQKAPVLADAAKSLRDSANYTWTVTTELPGAPFRFPRVTGTTDKDGIAVLRVEDGDKTAVVWGDARVVETGSGWKNIAALSDSRDPTLGVLINTPLPPDELQALAAKLTDLKSIGDNAFEGVFDEQAAKAYLLASMPGGGPDGRAPKVEAASGQLRLWLKDGVPQSYTITITARLSLPMGSREVSRTSTTDIRDLGTTRNEVPEEAKKAFQW